MFPFKHQKKAYHMSRNAVYSMNGMVATSQPLASQAGLDILKKGGNAVDAAIATAACLTVVEPTSNGIGGDAFAIVWIKDKMYGFNGSGAAPNSISLNKIKKEGHNEIPKFGWIPVTVPGAPKLWGDLSDRFGKLSLIEVLKPAIEYAEKGYPLSPTLAKYWKKACSKFEEHKKKAEFEGWFDTFVPDGKIPEAGDVWQSKSHANTLTEIGETNAKSFYKGNLAKKIVDFSNKTNGYMNLEDFSNHQSEEVSPISSEYKGYSIWELPPNGQGIIALEALGILNKFDFHARDDSETFHHQIEALKLAFSDGFQYLTDPKYMNIDPHQLLSKEYIEERAKQIKEFAQIPKYGKPESSGTVYLATADSDGNMVSFIQSNYMGFGSGIVVPGTGIALQNRGHNFSFDEHHVNVIKGGKRPLHTIIPGFITKDDKAIGPFGVMGGFMMPQGHVQLLMNMIDFQLNPQTALDAPRFQWIKDKEVMVENNFKHDIAVELVEKGHDIKYSMEPNEFGRGQVIWRNPKTGILCGGSESRTDGSVASW